VEDLVPRLDTLAREVESDGGSDDD
jgi:hypothetical protein